MNIKSIQPTFKGTIIFPTKNLSKEQETLIEKEAIGIIIPGKDNIRIWNNKGPKHKNIISKDTLNMNLLAHAGIDDFTYVSKANNYDQAKAIKHQEV